MAYKRELIINNGSLTSYKKLLKVSDVCQLLDKSKYPATQTINGVTFTNNGDGTITVNGTTTAETYSSFRITYDDVPCVKGHIYCILGCPSGGSYQTYDCNTSWGDDSGNGNIRLFNRDIKSGNYYIRVFPGYTANNLVFKPQLFDLTEMYGAGNEPATVAEFKAKFPNDLYDYSPRCWVTSYKTGLIAETKNLFNINALTPYTPETLPNYTAGVYNGNIIARAGVDSSVCRSGKTLKQLCPDLVAGEKYVLSYETNATTSGGKAIFLRGEERMWLNGNAVIITETSLNSIVCFYANYPELTVATIRNFQIEKGSVATDYVPYGYL